MDREIEPNHELDYLAREVIRAAIAPVHLAQVLSYLKIKRLRLGLLINFNVANLSQGIKRVIHSP